MPAAAEHTPVPDGYILNSKIISCKSSARPDKMSLDAAISSNTSAYDILTKSMADS